MPRGTAWAPGALALRGALDVRQAARRAARARPTEARSTMSCAALPAGPPPGRPYVPLPLTRKHIALRREPTFSVPSRFHVGIVEEYEARTALIEHDSVPAKSRTQSHTMNTVLTHSVAQGWWWVALSVTETKAILAAARQPRCNGITS